MSASSNRWEKVKRKVPGWTTLASLNHNSVVKTAPIWLSLVPFLMRETGAPFSIPFNFLAYYFAAVFFGLAYIVITVWCPPLAKEAPSYGAYSKGGHSEVDLRNWFRAVARSKRYPEEADPDLILHYNSIVRGHQNLSGPEAAEKLSGKAGHAIMDPFWSAPAGARLPDVYDFARSTTNGFRPGWKAVVFGLYMIGFAFVATTFVYNTCSAWVYFQSHSFFPVHV